MAVNYTVYQDKRTSGKGLFYARAVHEKTINLEDLADIIATDTNNTRGEVLGLIRDYAQLLQKLILDGHKVRFGSLAILRLAMESKGANSAAEFSATDNVKHVRLRGVATKTSLVQGAQQVTGNTMSYNKVVVALDS